MSDTKHSQISEEMFLVTHLHTDTHKGLAESARRNGRTIHQEAEHIIKTHLSENEGQQTEPIYCRPLNRKQESSFP